MRPELQAYLDGEIGREELPPELRREAELWENLFVEMRRTDPREAPASLESAVLRSLGEETRDAAWRRAVDWALRPRPIRVSPLAGLAAAAAIALLFVLGPGDRGEPGAGPAEATTVYVQFLLEAPQARSVAIAGDFNDWQPEVHLEDPDGDGVWTGRIPMRPGVHHYMFVIDGSEWQTDPRAERYTDDGFGNRNAVLVVPRPASKS